MTSKFKIIIGMVLLAMIVVSCAPAAPVEPEQPVVEEPVAEEPEVEEPVVEEPEVVGEPETIKIGGLYPLTGTDAVNGQNYAITHDYAVEVINEAGGVECLGGAMFEMVYGDTRSTSEAGNTETERLITSEGVVAIVGAFHSHVVIPATEISERYEVPFIVANAISPAITGRGLEYLFMTIPTLTGWANDNAQFAVDNGAQTAVIATQNIAFGEVTKNEWEAALDSVGLETLDSIVYQFGGTDFSDAILRIRSLDPDVLFLAVNTADAIIWINQLQELNYFPTMGIINMGGGFIDPTFMATLGTDQVEGLIMTADWFPQVNLPGAQELNEQFLNETGISLGGLNATLASMYLLRDALEISCSYDPIDLANVLRSETFTEGEWNFQWTQVSFDESGEIREGKSIIAQYQNGEQVAVWPPDLAIAEVIWPVPSWDQR